VYQAKNEAFYDLNKVWNNDTELFPYRFRFGPHPEFEKFTNKEAFIYVSELYKKIKQERYGR
jgi:hypothetical protein